MTEPSAEASFPTTMLVQLHADKAMSIVRVMGRNTSIPRRNFFISIISSSLLGLYRDVHNADCPF